MIIAGNKLEQLSGHNSLVMKLVEIMKGLFVGVA